MRPFTSFSSGRSPALTRSSSARCATCWAWSGRGRRRSRRRPRRSRSVFMCRRLSVATTIVSTYCSRRLAMWKSPRAFGAAMVIVSAVVMTAARQPEWQHVRHSRVLHGPEVNVGGGTARLFVEVGVKGEPQSLGIKLTDQALGGLARRMNTTSRCWDKNGDGTASHGECLGDYEAVLA